MSDAAVEKGVEVVEDEGVGHGVEKDPALAHEANKDEPELVLRLHQVEACQPHCHHQQHIPVFIVLIYSQFATVRIEASEAASKLFGDKR